MSHAASCRFQSPCRRGSRRRPAYHWLLPSRGAASQSRLITSRRTPQGSSDSLSYKVSFTHVSLDKTAAARSCMLGTETRRTNERRRARDPQWLKPGLKVCWFTYNLQLMKLRAFGQACTALAIMPRSAITTPVLGAAQGPANTTAITARRINTIIAV